jgi:hypothetical protein
MRVKWLGRAEFAMKRPLLIALIAVIVLGAGSGLAAMHNACKKGHHSWCASSYSLLHHSKNGHS